MTIPIVRVVNFSSMERWDPPHGADSAEFKWPSVLLSEVAQIRLGMQVPRKGSSPHGVSRPYLRSMNVRRGELNLLDVKTMHLTETQAVDLELRENDLLFVEGSGSIGEVGRTALWDASIAGTVHQNSVVRARLHDDRLDHLYVTTWFNSRAGNAYIREQATTTSGLYHIGAGKLAGAPIPVPPLELQREIVAKYSEMLHRANEAASRSIALQAAAWDSFASELVSAPLAMLAADMVTITNFSALDRWDTDAAAVGIVSLYPQVHLSDVADIRLGTQVPRSGANVEGIETPYLRAANVQRGYVDTNDLKSMRVSANTIERLALKANDVLFVEGNSHEEVGRAAVWLNDTETTILQNSIVRARLTNNELDPEFVATWFNCDAGRSYVRDQATTTSGSLWHIGAGKLAAAPLPVPPREVQLRLVAELRDGLKSARSALNDAAGLRELAEADLVAALVAS